jgi:hypothetical protein
MMRLSRLFVCTRGLEAVPRLETVVGDKIGRGGPIHDVT